MSNNNEKQYMLVVKYSQGMYDDISFMMYSQLQMKKKQRHMLRNSIAL
jgi:hypothetical protein